MSNWMAKLTKDFGMAASDMTIGANQIISMPSPSLNWAVGNGGIIEGKAVCLYGPESGGKSLLMQLMIAEIQRRDKEAIGILFDSEYAFNKEWFRKLGGDPNRLVVRQTNDPLKIFDYIEKDLLAMLQDGAPVRCLGIDSIKGIRYPKDHKKQSTDITMGGGGASYLGPALKAILPVIREYGLTTLMVQQVYEELDPMKALANPYKVPDGRALKHFCDYMLEVTRVDSKAGKIFDPTQVEFGSKNNLQVGHEVKVKVKKNRCGAPYRTAKFNLAYDSGIINTTDELVDLAVSLGIVFHPISASSGKPNPQAWQVGNHEPQRGIDAFKDWVKTNPGIFDEIVALCNGASAEASEARNSALKSDTDLDINLDELE